MIRKSYELDKDNLKEVYKALDELVEDDLIKNQRLVRFAEFRALYTTPDYLLGFEEKLDSFEAEAMGILQGIKDDTIREMLL